MLDDYLSMKIDEVRFECLVFYVDDARMLSLSLSLVCLSVSLCFYLHGMDTLFTMLELCLLYIFNIGLLHHCKNSGMAVMTASKSSTAPPPIYT